LEEQPWQPFQHSTNVTQATIWEQQSIGRDFLIVGEKLNRDFRIQLIRQVFLKGKE